MYYCPRNMWQCFVNGRIRRIMWLWRNTNRKASTTSVDRPVWCVGQPAVGTESDRSCQSSEEPRHVPVQSCNLRTCTTTQRPVNPRDSSHVTAVTWRRPMSWHLFNQHSPVIVLTQLSITYPADRTS